MTDWLESGPMSEGELATLRGRISQMGDAQLQKLYGSALFMCTLDRGQPPRAPFIQQLVQAWRELDRRRRLAKTA